MKKIIYIFSILMFAVITVNIISTSAERGTLEVYGNHQKIINKTLKGILKIDNQSILSTDEYNSDAEFIPFKFDFYEVFLNNLFHQKTLQLYLHIEKLYLVKTLPKYILFHSLQVDYI